MKENKIAIGLVVIILVIIAVAVGFYFKSGPATTGSSKSDLKTFVIDSDKKSFVLTADNLSGAEIWIVPTGTNLKEEDNVKLVAMVQEGEKSSSGKQTWVAHIPLQQFLATKIFVKGYGAEENEVGRLELKYKGLNEIQTALSPFWPKATSTKR